MPDIYFVDELTPVNPFSAKGQYDDNWVELSITDSNEYQMMTGKTVIFSFKVSKRCEGWQLRAMDYVSFQLLNNRNVISEHFAISSVHTEFWKDGSYSRKEKEP